MRARRRALDRHREAGHQELERGELHVAEAGASIRGPGGIGAVHHADRAAGAEPVDHRDVVGHALAPQIAQDLELVVIMVEAPAEGRGAAFVEPMEGALHPQSPDCSVDRDGRTRPRWGPRRRAAIRTRGRPEPDAACRRPSWRAAAASPAATARSQKPCEQTQLAPAGQSSGGDPLDHWQEAGMFHDGRLGRSIACGKTSAL